MEIKCMNCGDNMDAQTANVQTDLIQCPNCFAIHQLSQLMNERTLSTRPVIEKERDRMTDEFLDSPSYENMAVVPLHGSKIQTFYTRSSLEITIPPGKLQGGDFFVLGFSIFWLGFVAVWTLFAAIGFLPMAFFSIPFWLVGFGMAGGLVKKITQTQIITLDRYMMTITKKGIFRDKIIEIQTHTIDSIKRQKGSFKTQFGQIGRQNQSKKGVELPTVRSGVKDVSIFDFNLEAEQDWGMELLNKALLHFRNDRSF